MGYTVCAAAGLMALFETRIEWCCSRFDPSGAHCHDFFDRFYFWIMGGVILSSFCLGLLLSRVLHCADSIPSYGMGLGLLLIVLGYALRLYSIATLKGGFSAVLRVQPGQKTVTTGPFAYVRHPSYTGSWLGLLGLGLLSENPVILVILAVSTLSLMLIRIRREEALLVAHLPGYLEYLQMTRRRILPGLL